MSLLSFQTGQTPLLEVALDLFAKIGYKGPLVERDYPYSDRFAAKATKAPERRASAALFGRVPVAYDTALFGFVLSNGLAGPSLVNQHRSLGAPLIIEVRNDNFDIWSVGRNKALTKLQHRFDKDQLGNWVSEHKRDLEPREFMRTKELRGGPAFYQESLFAGLIPELEETIVKSLDPLLRRVFSVGVDTYKMTTGTPPPEPQLFKLGFWLLTGKVFTDRGHSDFSDLWNATDPDQVLSRVAQHYKENLDGLLNRQTRDEVFKRIWSRMDFRNLSVEVLSEIWSRTLVTPATRKRLGIHRTRRSIVRYIIEQIPFEEFAPEERRVLEPCTGSATFLIGALDRMRDIADMHDPGIRHAYFQRMLGGIEKDPFGVEIGAPLPWGRLADYPNPNGWRIMQGDVFSPGLLTHLLPEARIVLCNPPFEKFDPAEKAVYGSKHWYKPAELLSRILESLRPDAVIGFVMPRAVLDGQSYPDVRSELVRRFGKIDLVSLPDKAWGPVNPETVLLTATQPRTGDRATVTHAVVKGNDWKAFDWFHYVRSRDTDTKTIQEANKKLIVPELREIWEYLAHCPRLGDFANPKRGIEWNVPLKTHEHFLVGEEPFPESRLGVPPNAKIQSLQRPMVRYLNFSTEYRRRTAFDLPWDRPKVLMNHSRRSRGMWTVSAFADFDGLVCYRTFLALWPKNPDATAVLEAVLNGPVANAFLAVYSKKLYFSHDTIRAIPFPILTERQSDEINRLVRAYKETISLEGLPRSKVFSIADDLLRQLDATILEAYGLLPRLERRLLDAFNGEKRVVPFSFADYFPGDFAPSFTLKEWLSGRPARATAGNFRAKGRNAPDHVIRALEVTDEAGYDEV